MQDIVEGMAIQQLRRQFGLTPGHLARMTHLTEAQVHELEQGGMRQFQGADHKIRCALRVAGALSGVQDNGLPKVNVFTLPQSERVLGPKPRRQPERVVTPVVSMPQNSPQFHQTLLMIFVAGFLCIGVLMPLIFGTEPPHRIEKSFALKR